MKLHFIILTGSTESRFPWPMKPRSMPDVEKSWYERSPEKALRSEPKSICAQRICLIRTLEKAGLETFDHSSHIGTDIRDLLRTEETTRSWMEHLDAIGDPPFDVTLPRADDFPSVLLRFAVPHEDINDLTALLPNEKTSPEIWWLLRRSTYALVLEMGEIGRPTVFPQLPEYILGSLSRYFFVYVFVAIVPHVLKYHQNHGILESESLATFAQLGRSMTLNRQWYGIGGLGLASWLTRHFRGLIFALGRLHYERVKLDDRLGLAVAAAGLQYGPGDLALSIHIPGFSGPMTPSACNSSLARARTFFTQHFPDDHYGIAICISWLLDNQLSEYLPASSNIIQFQHRFELAALPGIHDEDIILNAFGRFNADVTTLPRSTTLERAISDHILAGKHWHGGLGWLRL